MGQRLEIHLCGPVAWFGCKDKEPPPPPPPAGHYGNRSPRSLGTLSKKLDVSANPSPPLAAQNVHPWGKR